MYNVTDSKQDRVDRTAADPIAKNMYDDIMRTLAEASIAIERVSFRCRTFSGCKKQAMKARDRMIHLMFAIQDFYKEVKNEKRN